MVHRLLPVKQTPLLRLRLPLTLPPVVCNAFRPVADALATLDPADSNPGGGSKAAKARGGDSGGDAGGSGGSATAKSRVGGGGVDGGGGAVHPERQRRVQREMMDWMRNPHEVHHLDKTNYTLLHTNQRLFLCHV